MKHAALIWCVTPTLINVALTSAALIQSLIIPAMKVHCDIVSDNWGSDYLALASVALTSMTLTWSLTILALIDMALTSVLWHNLTIPAVINVTDTCDCDMDCGSDKVQKAALTCTGSGCQVSLLRSTYPGHLVYHVVWFERWVQIGNGFVSFTARKEMHWCNNLRGIDNASYCLQCISTQYQSTRSAWHHRW